MSIILVFHLLSVVGFVLGSIWLSSWANDADMAVNGTQPNNTYFRLGVYAGYVGIQGKVEFYLLLTGLMTNGINLTYNRN